MGSFERLTAPQRLGLGVAAGLAAALALSACTGVEEPGPDLTQGEGCIPAHYKSAPGSLTRHGAVRAWYDRYGHELGAPSDNWNLEYGVSVEKMVNGQWTLLLETSTSSMGGYSVTDLVCD